MSDARLPRNARDIIDRLGPAVTLRLIRALGGTTIPVPMRLTPVGEARYRRLCDYDWGGCGKGFVPGICRNESLHPHMQTGRPRAAYQHRDTLIRASRIVWGLDAPGAVFAAQIHTESWRKNSTVSTAGAQGLAQFMPSTAKWLPTVAPEVGKPAPFNPGWSFRACVTYDKYLWDRLAAKNAQKKVLTPCDRMAFALSAYNGGMGWTKGYGFTVLDVPPYPVSRRRGGTWEEIVAIIREDGSLVERPAGFCERCVFFLSHEEWDAFPTRPTSAHMYDLENGEWVDPCPFAKLLHEVQLEIRNCFEIRRWKIWGKFIPQYEQLTWSAQVAETTGFLNGEARATPYIDAFLAARTDEGKPDKESLCRDILANHAAYLRNMVESTTGNMGEQETPIGVG